jgi:two-component system chemotaxis response regulator CheY
MKTHIFLVDNDMDEMKIFVEALTEVVGSFKCTYASNGIHALKMLFYLKPEAIFIDYNMPVMNGLQLIAELKKNENLGHIPVLLYATHVNAAIRQKAGDLGVRACLQKPCTMGEMVTALKNIFTDGKKSQHHRAGWD